MKKFIKFLIIALMVIAAVTLTCYIFFKNFNKIKQKEASLIEFSQSETKDTFNSKLASTILIVNSDNTDARFDVMLTTLNKLDSSIDVLSSYYIESNGVVKSNEIASQMNSVNGSMGLAIAMMDEINIKAFIRDNDGVITGANTFYNRHLGANDLYTCVANYITEYAELVKLVNNSISNVNKDIDLKFSIIELYADVAISSFSTVEQNEAGRNEIVDYSNINFVNSNINWNNMQLQVHTNKFGDATINFIKYYNLSNKTELAKKLHSTYSNIDGVVNPTNEQRTVIYFKEVFGL